MIVTIDRSMLVMGLWEPYRRQVASGEPVFFSFSRDSVAQCLAELRIETEDYVRLVSDAARELMDIYETEVEVREETYEINASGFTSVIILVAQQVLAVEEMVREQGGFSENAYFPRLRHMISRSLPEKAANPFEFRAFEAIWRQLAQEIRSLPGSTSQSVSFRFGIEGASKARQFPLSQALLTREDLHLLVRRMGHHSVLELPPDVLQRRIQRESVHLGRRAQQHIAMAPFRARIAEQLRAFAAVVPANRFTEPQPNVDAIESLRLEIFRDSSGWISDDFRVILLDAKTRRRSAESSAVRDFLAQHLPIGTIKYFPRSDFGDSWVSRPGVTHLSPEDSLVALYRIETRFDLSSVYAGLNAHVEQVLEQSPIDLPEYTVRELRLTTGIRDDLIIYRDSLLQGQDRERKRYEWTGGFCVDDRARRYLLEALPDSIVFSDVKLSAKELVAVNGKPYNWEQFERLIRAEQGDVAYELEFPGRRTARLSIAINRPGETERVGFQVTPDGIFNGFVEQLSANVPALVGYDESTVTHRPPGLSIAESSALLSRVLGTWPHPLSKELAEQIDRGIASPVLLEGTRRFLQRVRAQLSGGPARD